MTVTAHCMTRTWELKSFVLQTKQLCESHTGANISEALKECTDEWGITEKVVAISTDNAANATAAVRLCGWRHVPCLAHTLNLVVKAALASDDEVIQLKQRVKDIVSYFHRSIKASDELEKIQKQLSLPEHRLIQDVETRWNSTYFMFERYIEQHTAITTALCLLNQNSLCISNDELEVIKAMIMALKPFEIATRELSCEKHVSVSKVIPLIWQLQGVCSSSVESNSFSRQLNSELRNRFTGLEKSYVLAVATLCDPRFKKIAFIDAQAIDQAERRMVNEMSTSPQIDINAVLATDEPSDIDTEENKDLWTAFDNRVTERTASLASRQTSQIDITLETKLYFNEPNLPRKDNPLMWWKDHENKYPSIAKLALKYLCISATSVPSERLFSKAGEVVSKKRNRIKPKNVDMMLFLNQDL